MIDCCLAEQIPVFMSIPLDRRIAEAYPDFGCGRGDGGDGAPRTVTEHADGEISMEAKRL